MTAPLSARQQTVLTLYITWLQPERGAEIIDVRVGQSIGKVARILIPTTQGGALWFVATVADFGANEHVHQFVGVYDSNDLSLCELMAALSEYDANEARLAEGHTVPLSEQASLRKFGYVAALIVPVALHAPLVGLDKALQDLHMAVFAVVPLSEPELRLKRDGGLDALHRQWVATERDLLTIGKSF